jgi:hypothetical protein
MNNNVLAALAILVIVISSINFFIALNVIKSREAAASAFGQVGLCASFTPNITADTYHVVAEEWPFSYDVNATGELDSQVFFSDDTAYFDIDNATGFIYFVPEDEHVGVWNTTITTIETECNAFSDSLVMTFNVTSKNDGPYLISLVLVNESGGGTNATYYFYKPCPTCPREINGTVDLWEDVRYNLSIIADDNDLPNDTLSYTTFPPVFFSPLINVTTGKSSPFTPVQAEIGNHTTQFVVADRWETDQSADVIFTVHNTNDAPVLQNKTDQPGGLGAITTEWEEPFYYDVNATDEDLDPLSFYVNFTNCSKLNGSLPNCTIFSIDVNTGEINFTPTFDDVGNYTVNYTVTDGMAWDWYLGSFSIPEFKNLPPNITDWHPSEYNVTISEGESQYFNITVTDDAGIPFAQWYKDNVSIAGASGLCFNDSSEYTFTATYSDSGIYNITVMVDDGQYVVSHDWRLIVLDKEPPRIPPSGPPSRPPSITVCVENWRCTIWSACSKESIQIRTCADLSRCNTTVYRPLDSQRCIYTPYPDCYDGIKNCHGGGCEILTDCGGPCPPCPTCSDGIKNCHVSGECEDRVDCGGPCTPCPAIPKVAVCGNGICEAGEFYDCMEDCLGFWIDTTIFILIIILLIILSILLYVYKRETVLLYVYRKVRGE